jgi:serine/threonine protein kinase
VADRYELQALLGRGATGVVFRALDRRTGDEVAVKTLAVGASVPNESRRWVAS